MKRAHKLNRFGRRSLSALLALVLAFSLLESGVFAALSSDPEDGEPEETAAETAEETPEEVPEDTAGEEDLDPVEETFENEIVALEEYDPAGEEEIKNENSPEEQTAAVNPELYDESEPDGNYSGDGEEPAEEEITTYAAGDVGAFAVYCDDDKSLTFYYGEEPSAGGTFNEKTVTNVYTGFDSTTYSSDSSVPWYSRRTNVTSVVIDESFSECQPIAMAYWFFEFTNATFEGLENIDTTNVTTLCWTFGYCSCLTSIDGLAYWDASSLTTLYYTFYNCSGIQDLKGISGWNVSNVTTLERTFRGCSSLTSVNELASWNTSSVTNMQHAFCHCSGLTNLDGIAAWNTSKVTNMQYMFFNCTGLTNVNGLANWNTSAVTTLYVIFRGCSALENIDGLANWDTSAVTTLYQAFYGCSSLKNIDGLSSWDTSNVTNMEYMFFECYALQQVDFSGWNTSAVEEYDYFLTNCPELRQITLGASTSDESVSDFDLFYKSTEALVSEKYWLSEDNVLSEHYMIGVNTPGTYHVVDGSMPFAVYSETDNSLIFYCDEDMYDDNIPVNIPNVGDTFNGRTVTGIYVGFEDSVYEEDYEVPWHDIREDVKTVSFDESFASVRPVSVEDWFYDFACVEEFDFTNLYTSEVVEYSNFTTGCYNIGKIILGEDSSDEEISSFDLLYRIDEPLFSCQYWMDEDDNIQSDNYMIGISTPGTYYSTVQIDSDVFAIYSADDNSLTFYRNENMVFSPKIGTVYNGKTINGFYSGFCNDSIIYSESNTAPWYGISKDVKTVSFDESFSDARPYSTAYWFHNFKNTTSFDFTYLNTSEVTDMEGMFYTCQSAEQINVSEFDVSKVTTVNKMFRDCSAMTEIDLTNWKTSSLQNMGQFIQGCTSLTEVDFSMLDVSHCTALANIFNQCTNLVTINVSNWDTSKGTGFAATFYECYNLTTIYADEGSWDISNATNKTNTFYQCYSLVGGNGTEWSEDHITADMAHIDTEDNPGYFTLSPTITVSGSKTWNDADDADGKRPGEITIRLLADGTEVDSMTVTEQDDWSWRFEDLDRFSGDDLITYTISEDEVEGYATEINGYDVTNTRAIDISVTKVWADNDDQDGMRDDYTLTLTGTVGDEKRVVYTDSQKLKADTTSYTWEDLDKYYGSQEIQYSVEETVVPTGYTTDSEPVPVIYNDADGTYSATVTNTHEPETIDISVIKEWDDAGDRDGIRPKSVTIDLLANGKTVETADVEKTNYGFFDWIIAFFSGTLSNENEWTYTWYGLPKYADGEEITYTVAENTVPEGYTATVGELTGEDGAYNITIINTELFNGDGTFRVVLVWDDEANNDGLRPAEVNVTLTSDNAKVDGMTLTLDGSETDEDGNWIGTFTGLDKYADGEEITYSVKEDIRSGYTYKIELLTDNEGNTYVQLTNVHVSVKEEIGFTKIWDDESDQDGKRPDEITIRLLANGGLYKEVKLTEDNVTVSGDGNKWEYTLKDIPVDKNGVAIEYTLTEEDIDDYTSSIETTRGSEITDNEVTYRPYFFTATNSYTPETIDEISGSKTWDDADNQDGMRPKEITIRLLADGSEVDSMTVSEKDGWSWTFTGLPKYAGGEEITYTITEDAVENYDTEYDGYNVTNTHTPGQTSLTVVKSWNDEENQDGIRPQSVEVTLLKNGVATDQTITLSDSNGWTDSFIELDEYTSGVKNEYTVQETEVEGYTATVTGDETEGYQITNTHEPETVDVAGSITWDDEDNEFGFRPYSITVHLFADDTEIDSMVVTAEDNWTWDFGELPQYADGQEITYSFTVELTAEESEHYTVEVDGDRVIIHLNNEIFDLTVVKIWEDADDQDGIRPESVEITLLNNGEPTDQTLTLSEENDWEGDFTDLEEHTSNVWNDYTIQESAVGGYTCEITGSVEDGGYVVVNTHTPETVNVSGSKTWDDNNDQDGMRPDSITIRLLADGTEADSAVVTAEDGWSWTFEDLDKYENGEEITYTIVENAVEDYSVTYDGYDVTNSYTPEKTSVSVVKAWDDSSDADGTRPDEITVTLLQNGTDTGRTLTLSSGDGWQGSFTELDVYDSGEKIDYTVRESEPDGYTSKITGDAGSGYVITNTLVRQETTDVTVTILWDDNDDAYGSRPSSLTVHLYADGVEIASQVVTAEDGWTWDFGQLDKYDADGNEISYTFSVDSPEGGHYVFEIDGNTITARYTPGDNTESPGPTVSGNGGNGGSGGKGGTSGNNPSPKTDGPEPAIRMIALAAGIAAAAVGGAALSLRAYRRSRVVYVGKRLKK